MIVIDTLVHHFLHRHRHLLHRFAAPPMPMARPATGQAAALCPPEVVEIVAARIDARTFNRAFPAAFPRFVQHAIWRYCAQNGLAGMQRQPHR